ncbi:MAG: Excinuclease ABC, C subunit domain protein [Parcubacteria group bacterium GW2011_GWA2_33_14]|uniref:Excinuclease ABC subunit C n=1 Tax=Candidatus Staskawiczbacteria bacterium RIFCSPHIGHO2_02_FULL_33_16 TaxID=1802204 RepID=A0A1G2HXJ8_9BACT|nr:MAG: Excinuclease ABC, C subunit domain protein [Parcubacteria group bacterium GW2011_GWA2_33_14]OGZ67276.1 MAG: hypothetical protein A3D34_00715 [Candidatus Staskawiczbacteria bacterium RIFCSPHIGHO2_02_FULL_33_16]
MDKPTIITKNNINQLPKTPGVYFFMSSGKNTPKAKKLQPVYIGKAINIKDRVKNHFLQPTYKDNFFIENTQKIGFIKTNSEIEALILESHLIKKYQPRFNAVWKDDKNYFFVAITKEKKPIIFITHQKNNLHTTYLGPFVEGNALKKILKYLRRVFPYYTSGWHPLRLCTWCHLGLCPGPNPNLGEYQKNIKKLMLILEGKSNTALKLLQKEMRQLSEIKNFEKAAKIRDQILALQNIMSHTRVTERTEVKQNWENTEKILQQLLRIKKPIPKIECYDISNIQGKNATGSMVVFINGNPEKKQYKKFKIKMKNEPNDIAMLKEVLQRRMAHSEWAYPELMLIDGGIAQLHIGIKTKNQKSETKNIKIISIAKGKKELLIEGQKIHIPLKNLPQEIYNLIVALDDEAHRFAITYHKKLRKKSLLSQF